MKTNASAEKLYRIINKRHGKLIDSGKTILSLQEAKKRLINEDDEIVVFIVDDVITKKSIDRDLSMIKILDGFPNERQSRVLDMFPVGDRLQNIKNLIMDGETLTRYTKNKKKDIFDNCETIEDYVALLSVYPFTRIPYTWMYKADNGDITKNPPYSWTRKIFLPYTKVKGYHGDVNLFNDAKEILKIEKEQNEQKKVIDNV